MPLLTLARPLAKNESTSTTLPNSAGSSSAASIDGTALAIPVTRRRCQLGLAGSFPTTVTTLLPLFYSGLNFSRPLAPAALAEFWRESVVPDLERAIAQTVLYARRDGPLAVLHGLLRAGAAHRSVAVLSLDAVLDQGGRVHVVDVNTNGNLQGDYSLFNTQACRLSIECGHHLRCIGGCSVQ